MIDSALVSAGGIPLLATVLSASVIGSVHCAGMCGPFVAVYSAAGEGRESPASLWSAHAAYHGGRAVTYLSLGAIAGTLGAVLDLAGTWAGFSHVAALISGVLVMFWGASVFVPGLSKSSPLARYFAPRLAQLGKKPRVFRASMLGIFTPLLPCGWLYAFALIAAGTGGALSGVLVMGAFWLGTVPALLGMGALVSRFGTSLRRKLPVVTGIALIVLGGFGVARRMVHVGQTSDEGTGTRAGEQPSCH